MADEYASISEHIDAQEPDSEAPAGDPVVEDTPIDAADASGVDAPAPEVPTAPALSMTPEHFTQLGQSIAQAVAQGLAPMFEQMRPPHTPAAPAPKPWEMQMGDLMRAPMPEHATDYTQGLIAEARKGLAQWGPIAEQPEHERHGDAKQAVAAYREKLRQAHHMADMESRLAQSESRLAQLQRAPQVSEMQSRARAIVADADQLTKHNFPGLAAAVRAGEDLSDLLDDIEWSDNEKAVAGLASALRFAERVYQRRPASQAQGKTTPVKTHNPAVSVPPAKTPGTRGIDADQGYWSMDEHDAELNRKLGLPN